MREIHHATTRASISTAVAARTGGVLFVHFFGAALNAHLHLHLCKLDGVIAPVRLRLAFRAAQVNGACVERVQAAVRQQVLRLFVRRGLVSRERVAVMQGWGHSGGFSVHAGVRIAAHDREGRERLMRYCTHPLFAGGRLVWAAGGKLVRYRLLWPALLWRSSGLLRMIELRLSASELLDLLCF